MKPIISNSMEKLSFNDRRSIQLFLSVGGVMM